MKSPCPSGLPAKQGLYDPQFEHDACGVGFVVNIKGRRSRSIVRDAITILMNLRHRGACGCENNTGDGAGILIQTPHLFLQQACEEAKIQLPDEKQYGCGLVFLPPMAEHRQLCERALERIVREEGQTFLGWRSVPVNNGALGETAKAAEPVIRQVFIGRHPKLGDDMAFERKLYVIRRRAEAEIRFGNPEFGQWFYVPSLSHRTLVYKGMLMAEQLDAFFPELADPLMQSALALVHSRFSTNTFPSWDRAHPYRYVAHNGEINTLRGNINWVHARQALFQSSLFGDDLKKILPVICPDGSDSAMFDNCLEMLVLSGRSLPHAVMMMIPEPWQHHQTMSDEKKAFYEYHRFLMEPWDGPASISFTDGVRIGAVLDRNGLRPSRYYVTKDDTLVLASEVGVLDFPADRIEAKGRLQPGRMLLVDTEQKRIVSDEELKHTIATQKPYREWLNRFVVRVDDLPEAPPLPPPDKATLVQQQRAFGYTFEDERFILTPMATDGVEPLGSMGTDTPLAVLSNKPQLLYNYFKQLFAQVTNPPIDYLREAIITSTETALGAEGNLLEPTPENCRFLKFETPILSNEEVAQIKQLKHPGFKAAVLPILFGARTASSASDRKGALNGAESQTELANEAVRSSGSELADEAVRGSGAALEQALTELYAKADQAIIEGANILLLSDRDISKDRAPIPALLAVAGLHHHLIRSGTRTRASLVLESAEPREVHHFALLIGYGISAINPYLAFDTLDDLIQQGLSEKVSREKAFANYIKAAVKGVLKVASKMGISTIQSYRGAQIFEAIGLNSKFVEKYFTWTPSRVEGIGIEEIAREVLLRHQAAFGERQDNGHVLDPGGQYQWRSDGEFHLFNPTTIHKLQQAVRNNDYKAFKEYSTSVNEQARNLCTLRSLFEIKFSAKPIPIDEVEPVESIMRRFKSGAMSYGSISQEAHETLAIAMNRIGGKSNTGEGGEDPQRYVPLPNGDSKNSAIKQVASGRFGVTSLYLINAHELQIKMAQGAKPGEGGQLPGHKVYPWIARVRHSTPGVGLISPPPHHDIYSIEDLAQLIHDLKNANHEARISVKLVAEVGVGTIAAGVAKAHADVVLISGHDGGTGASPLTSIKHAGVPWELGLAETHQTLLLNNLRGRIAVEVDGQLKTGRDVVIAAMLGAEEFGFATAALVSMGCILMRVCHKNTCPVGVATQDPRLRKHFMGKPEHVVAFMRFIAQEVRELMAQLGFKTLNNMVGRNDRLEMAGAVAHWKARGLDFSSILYQPEISPFVKRFCQELQNHELDKTLDRQMLLRLCEPAVARREPVRATLPIHNSNRVVGTMVGSEITRRHGAAGLPEDTIRLRFKGSAGQSFGAFMPKGVTFELEGDANDYFGKGLSGAKLMVYPPRGSTFAPEENIIIGNVAFYGATSGEAYIAGVAGERFCVRNSGVNTVVEGIGAHGCEYMTGGRVVVLGRTGRNFAAGMSGGIGYVLDMQGDFASRCNLEMVSLGPVEDDEEITELKQMIERHEEYTGSRRAASIVVSWEEFLPKFVKVLPKDYARVLAALSKVQESGLSGEDAVMAAFVENTRDVARVGGG
ncbi:MAG: glutamate synthase large subunit [Verrucomicrobia bacterium]|nr:MAG: glutamate synthase large subunit [Verrucomicrobiota bacterium]